MEEQLQIQDLKSYLSFLERSRETLTDIQELLLSHAYSAGILDDPFKSPPPQRTDPNVLTSSLVDTEEGISELVDSLANVPNDPPSLYLDLEGVYLSRHGTTSIIQLLVLPENHVYLIDVHTLKNAAFCTPGKNNNHQTLKTVLESSEIQKAIFDVRNDSDALYAHFGINLAGIQDIQLMELACRTFRRRLVNGLSKCIENDAMLTAQEKQTWKDVKDRGVKLFSPQHGGSYEVFNQRPLSYLVESYCVRMFSFYPGCGPTMPLE